MAIENSDNTDVPRAAEPWRGVAASLTVAAAVFVAMVIGIMVATYLDQPDEDPAQSELLAALKARLAQTPTDEKLAEQIRRLDVEIRGRYFKYRRRLDVGAWLLLIGAVVLVASARWYGTYLPRSPGVQRLAEVSEPSTFWTPTRQNVIAVIVIAVALGVTLLFMGRGPGDRFTTQPVAQTPEPTPPDPALPQTQPRVDVEFRENWPQLRGPTGMGIVRDGDWPRSWDAAAKKNILWTCPIPLPGKSSPIIWGDRVYLTGADKDKRAVYAIDRATGRIVWTTPIPTKLTEPPHTEDWTGYAAPTPVTDGKVIVVFFASNDLVGLDSRGKIVWSKHFGKPVSAYGLASSPILYKDTVILQLDQGAAEDEISTIMAFKIATGDPVWDEQRNVPNSWSTPIVIRVGEHDELITCADPWVIAYDPANGDEFWKANVLGTDVACMPVYVDGKVIVTNEGALVSAIRAGGDGDITETLVARPHDDGMPNTASPVANKQFFLQAAHGYVTCLNTADGKEAWSQDFDPEFWASPTLAGDRVYLLGEDGTMWVFRLAKPYKLESTGKVGQTCHATPAFADGLIYIRGKKDLFCIGKGK